MARHVLEQKVWRVWVPAHVLDGQAIPESVEWQYEESRRAAIRMAVIAVHVREGVRPSRRLMRETATRLVLERTTRSLAG